MAALTIVISSLFFMSALGLRARSGNFRGDMPINRFVFMAGKLAMGVLWLTALGKAALGLQRRAAPSSPLALAGALLFTLGTALALASFRVLGRENRLGLGDETCRLETRGLYARSRNPMYTGFYLMAAGSLTYAFNLVSAVCLPLAVGVHHLVVLAEERFLARQCGRQWQAYSARVRRYVTLRPPGPDAHPCGDEPGGNAPCKD